MHEKPRFCSNQHGVRTAFLGGFQQQLNQPLICVNCIATS